MPLPVLLRDIVEALDTLDNEWYSYINRNTGELVRFSHEEAHLAEEDDPEVPAWQQEMLPKVREVLASEEYVKLPDKSRFHEYRVMEGFCFQVDVPDLQERLLKAIRGRGAFGHFKELIRAKGIDNDWYVYRKQALREFAVEFLEAQGIPFE